MTNSDAVLARFYSRVGGPTPAGCWPWQGPLDNGYGRFPANGKLWGAHRFAYEQPVAPVPDGLQLDHLCRNRSCVNPEHLEPVSIATNVLRGEGRSAANARKTHCKRGHPLDETNTYLYRNRRACVTCQREAVRQWRARRTEASA